MSTYQENYIEGTEYQDYIVSQMMQRGFPICLYSSRKYQYECGESTNGIEIKFDRMMAKTGNIYIEIAEKSNAKNPKYVDSGIMRMDNSWLYLIGDYHEVFILSVKQLREIAKKPAWWKKEYGIREVTTPTSKGFVFPKNGRLNFLHLNHFIFTEVQNKQRKKSPRVDSFAR